MLKTTTFTDSNGKKLINDEMEWIIPSDKNKQTYLRVTKADRNTLQDPFVFEIWEVSPKLNFTPRGVFKGKMK